ncbi:velvet factor-domain-containing protein [Naematelia encephala]|uniref:Velvet factor-domain-containing protein n=1 Tax=Naematelia encephala TaxID=71784 RepID=A0A1Y2BJ71_9TREE|nr:velvet factor-domain-containing protein [Naematelia encephala]
MYSLRVCQQPERARLCSYKEENETIDRRPVDPPPVVEVLSSDEHPPDSTTLFVRVLLIGTDNENVKVVKTPQGSDATAGEVVQTPEKLRLLDGSWGALCVFAKLSIRLPGVFQLKFILYETSLSGVEQISSTTSEPFEVYSPKLFKGMKESTPLTRHLAAQGLKVKLRTDTTVGRQSDSRRRTHASPETRQASPDSRLVWTEGEPVAPKRRRVGDDGMIPSIMTSWMDSTPRFDLSAFSLDSQKRDPSRLYSPQNSHPHPHIHTHTTTSTSTFQQSTPPPPPPPASTASPSKHRSRPSTNRLSIGPGDDGLPVLPFFAPPRLTTLIHPPEPEPEHEPDDDSDLLPPIRWPYS